MQPKAKMSVLKIYVMFFLIGVFLLNGIIVKGEETEQTTINENDLYARSAVLMDAESGRILYGKNESEIMPMASTTKIMTLIVALEQTAQAAQALEEQLVTISEYAASMPDVQLNIRKGEQYRLEDLCYSLMLESHNDSAAAIAEYIGSSSEERAYEQVIARSKEESKELISRFAKQMNQKAEEIGCTNSYFITPNGLDATESVELATGETVEKNHSTTASELAKIMSYCITKSPCKEQFLQITQMQDYAFTNQQVQAEQPVATETRSFSAHNHNAFLTMMEGAISGKTGFTAAAGYCYVGAVKRDDRTFVVALLACGWPNNKSYKWSDATKLINYGVSQYHYQRISEVQTDQTAIKEIEVLKGQTDQLDEKVYVLPKIVVNEASETGVLLKADEEIEVIYDIAQTLEAPIQSGTKIGTIQYQLGEMILCEKEVIVDKTVKKIDLKWSMRQVVAHYFFEG